MTPFRKLVDQLRQKDRAPEDVRTYAFMAKLAGISRSHLYNLMGGEQMATPSLIGQMAVRWGIPATKIERALGAFRT